MAVGSQDTTPTWPKSVRRAGALGLYVEFGAASFREVWVEPLS